MNKDTREKGITLIELIICLAILSILFYIIIPEINISTFNLKTTSRNLCQEIRNIRSINMTEDSLYCIIIKEDRYLIKRSSSILRTEYLPPNIKISDNIVDGSSEFSKIKFNCNGAPTYPGTIKIKDIDSRKYMEITIVPASGRILLKNKVLEE